CTTEACSFRDDYSQYTQAGVTILGVSPDTSKSHAKFKAKYGLPFPLLADAEHKVCELYKVWGLKKMMGREYNGVFRTTYLINEKGKIVRVFENVKPAGHSAEILAELKVSH
ncbi:MAG: peroxiredoxin, partial [Chloroflexi bacterium RBG_19FT_COMBO_47_9]